MIFVINWDLMEKVNMSSCQQCIVRKFSALKTLDKTELIYMSACKTGQRIKKGSYIFNEGDHLKGVYCIKSGVCKLVKLSSNGRNQIVKFIKKGDLLGQRSIVSDDAVSLSAVAIEDMEVCFIPKVDILSVFKQNSSFSSEIVSDICYDLKLANNQIVRMAHKTVRSRFATILFELEEEFGVDEAQNLRLKLSREEYANLIGTATESMIRMFANFSKENLIELKGKNVKIKDRDRLKQVVNA